MRTVTTSPIQNNENSDQQSDPKSPEQKPAALIQNNGISNQQPDPK
jgi:hypothetical protein